MTQKMIVGYCRAASSNQAQIDRQKKLIREYAKKQNLHVSRFYIDNGQSGATLERPEFERLLRDCKAGKIQKVFVTEMDRLARDMCLVTKAYGAFGRYNVKVWVGETNDLSFLKTVLRAVAEIPV